MNWDQALARLRDMSGLDLPSISGRANIKILSVDGGYIRISAQRGEVERPISELQNLVSMMDLNVPIHVETALHGSGSSRNQPETILANMPDVEYLYVNKRKHIVWVGHDTHPPGTIQEVSV